MSYMRPDVANPLILLMEEIRRSPVDMAVYPHDSRGFIHLRWLFGISSINSITIIQKSKLLRMNPIFFGEPISTFRSRPFRSWTKKKRRLG